MEYFKSISISKLAKLIKATKEHLYLCLPSIHPEVSDAISELHFLRNHGGGNVSINILVDFDAQTFRQGYGSFKSLDDLFKEDHNIKNLKNIRISFVISDGIGYYLFIESRTIIPAEKETINAVRIDPISIVRLKKYFFPDTEKIDFKNELSNAIIEESKSLEEPEKLVPDRPAQVNAITEKQIKEVETDLKQNPPLNPDYKRIVEYYSNKFQYVDLHYHGQKVQHYTITIPSKLLPYKNEVLRKKLLTRLKLFETIADNEKFKKFKKIEERKIEIAKEYLTPIKCRKGRNVLKINEKQAFIKELEGLRKELKKTKTSIYTTMVDEVKAAKGNLKDTMSTFLLENPTKEMIAMGKENYNKVAENIAQDLVNKINVDVAKLISKFKIDWYFSDITFEDLKDKELLSEFKEKKLINEEDHNNLADFGKGIKVQQTELPLNLNSNG